MENNEDSLHEVYLKNDSLHGDSLKEELGIALRRCRKLFIPFSSKHDIQMSEFTVMKHIGECVEGDCVYISDLQKNLFISKPAVSQILGSLEKKGYIRRCTYQYDRRRLVLALTPKGHEAMKDTKACADKFINEIIFRFGEENAFTLTELINRFADISETVRNETDCVSRDNIQGDAFFD